MKGHVMKIGWLLIRLVVGGLFIGHGSQKLLRPRRWSPNSAGRP
jgi:uncharacterized membrane protein YphA (DoxX/SURF4 family)